MYTYAKNSIRVALACFTIGALAVNPPAPEADNSGREHILALMQHEQAQVQVGDGDSQAYGRTQNLSEDLALGHIVDFFGCKTEVGRWYLEKTLSEPRKSNDSLIAQRQAWIRMLVENPAIKRQVDELIALAREYEQEVIVLLSDFFKGKSCPELKQLEHVKQQMPWLYPWKKLWTHNPIMRTIDFINQWLTQSGMLLAAYQGIKNYDLVKQVVQVLWQRLNPAEKAYIVFVGGATLVAEGFMIRLLYKDCVAGAEKRTKIHALNRLMYISQELETLAQELNLTVQNKFSEQTQADTSGMISGVKSSRYNDKKSCCFAVPLVHTFLYKLYENEHQLAPFFASIAEIDAYNAIATKIIEHREQNNKFCFATFIDAATPAVDTTGFWNVLVKKPVVNSLNETHNIMLTGPNAGGKTTAIRALLQNIVLAQTYGVAAAEQFALTPFEVIHSYLNISDDLVNGLSLFASEVKRAQGIVETIKALQPGEKYFCALDELFTGTVAEDGEKCAYQFIQRVTQCDTALFIYATHFSKLTTLEAESATCVNYKVDAPSTDAQGKLVYPYTLSRGINTAHVALALASEADLFA